MASNLTLVSGIGPKTAAKLQELGITTISQLAECSDVPLKNSMTIIERARQILGLDATPNTAPSEVAHGSSRYMIESHSWFEQKVIIPIKPATSTQYKLLQAIVYELTVEDNHRVACIVAYMDTTLKAKSFSPLFLQTLNRDLPVLTVNIQESVFDSLKDCGYSLVDTLNELSLVRELKH